jgi:hypothetical protein
MKASAYVFSDLPNSFIDETVQVCVVTRDVDQAVRAADEPGVSLT